MEPYKRAYRRSIRLWNPYVSRQKLRVHAVTICVNKHRTKLLDGMLSRWSFEAYKTLSNKVINFIPSLQMSLRTKCFFMWRESSYQQKIMDKKGKLLTWRLLLWWQKYVKWQHTKQTSAEQFRQSHRYATFRQRLRTLLRTLRLQRLPRIIWLLLRRARVRKRQRKTYHNGTDDNSAQHLNQDANPDSRSTSFEGPSPIIQYDSITIRNISNTSAHDIVMRRSLLLFQVLMYQSTLSQTISS